MLVKGGVKDGITNISGFRSFVHIRRRDNFCSCRVNRRQESYQTDKPFLIVIFFLAMLFLALPGNLFAYTPCHQDNSSYYYCDINGNLYDSYSSCYNSCYFSYEGTQIHISKSIVETVYLFSGILLGVLFILSIIVGLK